MKVYYTDRGDGFAVPTHYEQQGTKNGKGVIVPIEPQVLQNNPQALPIPTAQAAQEGVLITLQQAQALSQQQQPTAMYNNGSNSPAIIPAETATGGLITNRTEVPSQSAAMITWNLVLNFGTPAVADTADYYDFVIGDGQGLIQITNPASALPVGTGFKFGGTYAAASLSALNNIIKRDNIRLHSMQVSVNDPEVFANAEFMRQARTNYQGSVSVIPFNFEITQDGTQYNEKKRLLREARIILGGNNAILVRVPKLANVSINFYFQSVSVARDMEETVKLV